MVEVSVRKNDGRDRPSGEGQLTVNGECLAPVALDQPAVKKMNLGTKGDGVHGPSYGLRGAPEGDVHYITSALLGMSDG